MNAAIGLLMDFQERNEQLSLSDSLIGVSGEKVSGSSGSWLTDRIVVFIFSASSCNPF